MFFEQMHPTWQLWLYAEKSLLDSIEEKLYGLPVAPTIDNVMRAFKDDPEHIKAILLGQDPYPTPGDAIGLAFAMDSTRNTPRSLRNIQIELEEDFGKGVVSVSGKPDLSLWSSQGVMLLNRALTTIEGESGSHLGEAYGWQEFTLRAIQQVISRQPTVLLLWGRFAQGVLQEIELNERVLIVESAHPSPLSARNGFFGSRPFSRTNSALKTLGLQPIDWSC